jgi:hypothetical protein
MVAVAVAGGGDWWRWLVVVEVARGAARAVARAVARMVARMVARSRAVVVERRWRSSGRCGHVAVAVKWQWQWRWRWRSSGGGG